MKVTKLLPVLLVIALFSNTFAQTSDPPEQIACIACEELVNLRIPDVTISQVEQVQEPVPHCKVTGVTGSEINFELLLPEKWNSRFAMGGGKGGICPPA